MNECFEFEFNCKKVDLNRLGIDPKSVKCIPNPANSEKILIFGECEQIDDNKYLFIPYFINQEDKP